MNGRKLALAGIAVFVLILGGCEKPMFFEALLKDTNQLFGKTESEGQTSAYEWDFDKYSLPPAFDQETLETIGALSPVNEGLVREVKDEYERVEESTIERSDDPYQVPCADPDMFWDTAREMLNRYFTGLTAQHGTYEELTPEQRIDYAEVLDCRLIAGDRGAYAAETVVNLHVPDAETSLYKEYGVSWQEDVIRCALTVCGEQVSDYVYELKGIVQTEDARSVADTQVPFVRPAVPREKEGTYQIQEETLSVSYDRGKSWTAVPVTMEALFVHTDIESQGVPAALDQGSYVITPGFTAFLYGGEEGKPVTMILSRDQGKSWEEKKVSDRIAVRRSFLSVTENSIYAVTGGDKTMGSEYQEVLVSRDGGDTWELCASPSENGTFLTQDVNFVSDEVGFITVTSHETPDFYRTEDGGASWTQMSVELPVPYYSANFSMAWAPWQEGEHLVMYVGQDEYAPFSGMMCRYISLDQGRTWSFDGYGISQ